MYKVKEKEWRTQCRICKEHKTEVHQVHAIKLTIKYDNTDDIQSRIERLLIQLSIKQNINVGIEPIINDELSKFGLQKAGNSNIWKNITKFYLCINCMNHHNKGYHFKLNDESKKYVYKCWLFVKKHAPKLKVFVCFYCKEKFSQPAITIIKSEEGAWVKFTVSRVFCSEACSNLWIMTNEKK